MKKTLALRFAWVVSLIGLMPAFGQTNDDTTTGKDRDIYSSVASYPTDLRSSVLTVSQYPQVLVKLQRIQSRSSQSFQDLVSGYPRDVQEKFYELSRYPDRLKQLVRDGKKNSDAAQAVVSGLSKESQTSILYVYENHFKDLAKIDYIYQSSEEAMSKLLGDYSESIQNDFRKVIGHPEVMDLLTDNIDLTASLGEDYKENPNAVIAQLDSLSAVQQQNLADYKQEVENNPEMQKELENAADRFSSSYAQTDGPVDSYLGNQAAAPAPTVVNNYYYNNYNPYPYWFSYPYWYATPVWYPVPYYYHTGFYYGPGGRVVVFGFPSFSYSSWFFGFGYHYYPHLYTRYHVYYRPSYTYYGHYGNRYNNRFHESYANDSRRWNARQSGGNRQAGDRYNGNSGGGGRSTTTRQNPRYQIQTATPGGLRKNDAVQSRTNSQTSFFRPSTSSGRSRVVSDGNRSNAPESRLMSPRTSPGRIAEPVQRHFSAPSSSGGGGSILHSGSSGSSGRAQIHSSSGGGASRGSGGSGGGMRSGGSGGGRRGR